MPSCIPAEGIPAITKELMLMPQALQETGADAQGLTSQTPHGVQLVRQRHMATVFGLMP